MLPILARVAAYACPQRPPARVREEHRRPAAPADRRKHRQVLHDAVNMQSHRAAAPRKPRAACVSNISPHDTAPRDRMTRDAIRDRPPDTVPDAPTALGWDFYPPSGGIKPPATQNFQPTKLDTCAGSSCAVRVPCVYRVRFAQHLRLQRLLFALSASVTLREALFCPFGVSAV